MESRPPFYPSVSRWHPPPSALSSGFNRSHICVSTFCLSQPCQSCSDNSEGVFSSPREGSILYIRSHYLTFGSNCPIFQVLLSQSQGFKINKLNAINSKINKLNATNDNLPSPPLSPKVELFKMKIFKAFFFIFSSRNLTLFWILSVFSSLR